MKTGKNNYKYLKVIGGIIYYAEVEIKIKETTELSKIIDACSWKTLRESYPEFEDINWKKSAIEAAKATIENHDFNKNIEVTITDIIGTDTDTNPSHIGAAVIIAIFDSLCKPLDHNDIETINIFISKNNDHNLIPNYNELIQKIANKLD